MSGFLNGGIPDPEKLTPEDVKMLLKQRQDAMRFLSVLVHRLGGDVLINPQDFVDNYLLERDDDKTNGVVRLRAKRL